MPGRTRTASLQSEFGNCGRLLATCHICLQFGSSRRINFVAFTASKPSGSNCPPIHLSNASCCPPLNRKLPKGTLRNPQYGQHLPVDTHSRSQCMSDITSYLPVSSSAARPPSSETSRLASSTMYMDLQTGQYKYQA